MDVEKAGGLKAADLRFGCQRDSNAVPRDEIVQAGMALHDDRAILMRALVLKQAVTARYNGEELMLAPHVLFERRGELFLRALNMRKNWRTAEQPRLGQFKIAGLAGVQLTGKRFKPLPAYRTGLPQPDDELVLAV